MSIKNVLEVVFTNVNISGFSADLIGDRFFQFADFFVMRLVLNLRTICGFLFQCFLNFEVSNATKLHKKQTQIPKIKLKSAQNA